MPDRAHPDPAPSEPTDEAALALRRFRMVFNAVRTHFRQMEKQTGLGGALIWALSLIQARPGIGVTEVARAMDIHQSTASNLIATLTRKQLVTTQRSASDRRVALLHTTPSGTALLQTVPGPFEGVLPGALKQLPQQSLCALNGHLGELIARLQVDEATGNLPLGSL